MNLRYSAKGYIFLGRQVPIETPYGTRFVDLQFKDPETGEIFNVEVKTNASAYGLQQRRADLWIEAKLGIKTIIARVTGVPLRWE